MSDNNEALLEYVATVNSGKYTDPAVIRSKFPEFEGVDQVVLDEYVATTNGGKYANQKAVNAKFPEFATASVPSVKDKNPWAGYSFDDETQILKDGEGNVVSLNDENLPEGLIEAHQAELDKGGGESSGWEFLFDTKNASTEQSAMQAMNKHRPYGKDLSNIQSTVTADIEKFKDLQSKIKGFKESIENVKADTIEKTPFGFGNMMMEGPGGNTAKQAQTTNTNSLREKKEISQRISENRNEVEEEFNNSRVGKFYKQAQELIEKDIADGKMKRSDVDPDGVWKVTSSLLEQADIQAHFDKSIAEELENETGLLDVVKTENQEKVVEKAIKYKDETLPKLIDENIKNLNYSKDQIIVLDAALDNFNINYAEKIEPLKIDLDNQGAAIEKELAALGEVNENSDPATIEKWNEINDRRTEWVGKINEFKADNEEYFLDYEETRNQRGQYYQNYQNALKKDLQFGEDGTDLVSYINAMDRNSHNVAVGGAWVATSALSMASGVEGFVNMVKELPEDLLFEYYDNDFTKMPPLVKVMKANDQFTDAMRYADKNKFSKFVDNINNSVSAPPEFTDVKNDIDELGMYAFHGLANFAPQVALMAATGGASIYIMGASSAGSKFDEMDASNLKGETNYTLGEKWLASGMAFGAETLSEKITFDIFKGLGNPVKERVKKVWYKQLVNNFSTAGTLKAGGNLVMESSSEGLAELGNNMADKWVLGKDISLLNNVDGAMVNGLFMERAMSMPALYSKISSAFAGEHFTTKMATLNTKQNEVGKRLNDKDLMPGQRKEIEKEWSKIQAEKDDILQKNVENLDQMSDKEKQDLVDLYNEIHDLQSTEDAIRKEFEGDDAQIEVLVQENRRRESEARLKKEKIISKYESEETAAARKEKYDQQNKKIKADIKRSNDRRKSPYVSGKFQKDNKFTEFETEQDGIDYFNDKKLERDAELEEEIRANRDILQNDNATRDDKKRAAKNIKFLQNERANTTQEAKNNSKSYGFIIQNKDGTYEVVVNKQNSLMIGGNINVAAHEFMHATLYKTMKGNPEIQDKMGIAVRDYVNKNKGGLNQAFIDKMMPYAYASNVGEEMITVMSESIADGTLKFNDSFFTKIGDLIRQNLQRVGILDIKFNTGKDVYNFIKDYNASIEKNYNSKALDRLMDFGADGSLTKSVEEAPKAQIQKSTPAGFENDVIVNDLGLNNETAKIVERNKKIEAQILAEGLKDSDGNIKASIKLANELVRNNLPRAFALARKAANKGKDLTLEEGLRMDDVSEWFSEYSAKLTELSRTYRARKNSKEVPFGAYMNALLPLKYSGILESMKSKVETSSLSNEATAKKVGKKTNAKKDDSKREDIEGTAVALETIGQGKIMPKLQKVYSNNKSKVKKQKTYKDVKSAIVKAKQEGPYFDALVEIAEIFSEGTYEGKPFKIDPLELAKRIRTKQDLTKPMRKVIQDVILKYSPEMINMIPGGTSAGGDATGIANTNLGKAWFIKKGKTKLSETGSRKGLNIQDKKGLNMQTFLAPFGLGEKGNRAKTKDIDGALREWVMQVATLAMNQASRQADPQNVSLLSTKDGKNPIQFSKPAEVIFGGIKSILTPEQGQAFENNIAQFVSNFVGINESKMTDSEKEQVLLSEDIEAIQIALDQVYGDTFSKAEKYKIAKEIAIQVGKLNLKPKSKRITKVQKIVDQIIKSTDAAQVKVAKFTGSNMTAAEAQDKSVRQETRRKADGVYFKREFDKNKEQAIADLLLIAGHSATSGKIGGGRGQYYEGTKDFYDTNLGKVGIKPEYDTFERSGKTVYTLNVEKTAKLNNLKQIPVTKASQSTGGAMSDHNNALKGKSEKLDARRKHESHARRVLNDYVAFNVEQYNKGLQDNVDIMLMMTGLLSNMNSVLARAGGLNLVQPGVTAKNGRYEHGHPRVAVLIRLMNQHLNKGGVKNLDKFFKNYDVNIIDTNFDDAITDAGYKETLADGQTFDDFSDMRMYNEKTKGDKRLKLLVEVGTENTPKRIKDFMDVSVQYSKSPNFSNFDKNNTIQKAIQFSKGTNNPVQGITVLDFDDTLATTKSLVKYTTIDGKTGTLNAEQYASTYEDLLEQGHTFDFSDFNKVVKGKLAPLFQKALKLQNKFGNKNMFVLTARPPAAQQAIYDFLTANGLNIPLENITGLANSTAEAKALWIADKVGKGYNDFYFADDALQNVQAVKNMLDQFDVKSKVQQAKIQFSMPANLSTQVNEIIEQNNGIEKEKRFSSAEGRARGIGKGKYKLWIPAGAEDFMGLMYTIASAKGPLGDAQLEFFTKALLDPYNSGIRSLNQAKHELAENYKELLKMHPDVKKLLGEKIDGTNFTYDHAVRVYLWNKAGYEIPGMAEGTKNKLLEAVDSYPDLKSFAESLGKITKVQEGYPDPNADWVAETIISDLAKATDNIGRAQFLKQFNENVDVIFSAENLNKIEAIYGKDYRDALENMLYRMKTGRNKSSGSSDAQVNRWTNWITNSVGAIMFLNMRSAILQTISSINFMNWGDNNPAKAAAAFANQKQFWSDFSMIFNSPYLKQRRSGLKTDVNEAQLANALAGKKNKVTAALAYLLKLGFTPTQVADSFAIASGGATFYRNRVKSLMKDGMSRADAEKQAFADMQEVANKSQQSSDPSLISRQQASILGRFLLAFQNTPMQYARIMKKAGIDLIKGRGDWKSNVSKIIYYGAIQNIIFNAMQQALFALAFDDEEEEKELQRQTRLANGMLDSILRGTGIYGAVVATGKNIALEFWKQDQKGGRADHAYTMLQFANISPPIGSKMRKLYSATQTRKFNKKAMDQMGYDIYNPAVPAIATGVEAFTNVPVGRLYQKFNNVSEALKEENENWQRIALMMGWNTWDVGVKQKKFKAGRSKSRSSSKSKSRSKPRN